MVVRDKNYVYEYRRGEAWSVQCFISGYDTITFINLTHPDKSPRALVDRFLNEAEIATFKLHNKGEKDDQPSIG